MLFDVKIDELLGNSIKIPFVGDLVTLFGGNHCRVLFLIQAHFKWKAFGNRAFFVFNQPCDSPHYRLGQSWEEALELSKSKLRTVMYGREEDEFGAVVTKITKKSAKEAGFPDVRKYITHLLKNSDKLKHTILTTKDNERRTWYFFNSKCFHNRLKPHYELLKRRWTEHEENYFSDPKHEEEDYAFELMDKFKDNNWKSAKTPKKVKPKKQVTPQQRAMFSAKKMSPDFEVSVLTVQKAVDMGYDKEDVLASAEEFTYRYKIGASMNQRRVDWQQEFLTNWVRNGYEFDKIKKDGRYKSGKSGETDAEMFSSLLNKYS